MEPKSGPDIVRTSLYVTISGNELMQVVVDVYRPEVVNDEVVVKWEVNTYSSPSEGKIYNPSEFPVITELIYMRLRKNRQFDPEMIYYQNCSTDA